MADIPKESAGLLYMEFKETMTVCTDLCKLKSFGSPAGRWVSGHGFLPREICLSVFLEEMTVIYQPSPRACPVLGAVSQHKCSAVVFSGLSLLLLLF